MDAAAVRRILVIRPGGLGDMLLLLPVLDALRGHFPAAVLDVVCERRNRDVLELADIDADALLYDHHPLRLLHTLRKRRYDIAIDTEQFHNFSAFFTWLSGAPIRIGYNINPLRNPLYTHLVSYAPDGHESEQFAALVHPVAPTCTVAPFAGRLRPGIAAAADTARDQAPASPLIAVQAGANAPFKRWDEDRLLELARRLHVERGCRLMLIGSGDELAAARRIADRLPPESVRVADGEPNPTLRETARRLAGADVFIGPDSGLAQLAGALGVPAVILFGPSSDAKWGPCAPHSHAVTHEVPCRPCCIFGYHKPCHTIACMQGISVDAVIAAVSETLRALA